MQAGSALRDDAQQLLKQVIRGHAPADGHHWHTLCQAMTEVADEHTADAEALLRDVVRYSGEIPLSDVSPIPHAMSPTDALKSRAIQALGKWNRISSQDLATFEETEPPAVLRTVAQAQPLKR